MKATQTPTRKAASPFTRNPAPKGQLPVKGGSAKPIRVLVPVDFSRPAGHALQAAGEFAKKYGGRITLVTVIEPDPFNRFETNMLAVRRQTLERRLRSELREFGHKLVGKELIEKVLVCYGQPSDEIVKSAGKLKMDLIIMATHGRTGLKRLFLGSTAERVIRYAPCAVLTVRGERNQGWPADRR